MRLINAVCPIGPAVCTNDESRLVNTLFTGYNKVVRPVNHFSEAVEVTVGLQLIQLISVVRDREPVRRGQVHFTRRTETLADLKAFHKPLNTFYSTPCFV